MLYRGYNTTVQMKLFPFKSKNEFYKSDLMLEIAPLNFNFLILLCQNKITDELWFLAREYGR